MVFEGNKCFAFFHSIYIYIYRPSCAQVQELPQSYTAQKTIKRHTVEPVLNGTVLISQNWYNATDNSKEGRSGVHALFLDFRKAFDLVDHGILLRKLAELNVNKSFWMWTKCFLEEKSQQVKLGDTKSRTMICRVGVPPGSVISPTLFNVHINYLEDSIPGHLNVSSCKYTDDCTQYDIIQEDDNSKIQEALDAVTKCN